MEGKSRSDRRVWRSPAATASEAAATNMDTEMPGTANRVHVALMEEQIKALQAQLSELHCTLVAMRGANVDNQAMLELQTMTPIVASV